MLDTGIWRLEGPNRKFFLERKEQECKMKEWIVGSLSTVLGLEENVKCQGAQSAMVKGNVFWGGGPSWVTKYSNSKAQMSLRTTYYLYLDPKSCQRGPSLHRWLKRPPCGHEHITRSLITPCPKARGETSTKTIELRL